MRVSTSMMYEQGVASIQNQYADLTRIQHQMSTGRRMLVPSDDPLAAGRALDVSQSQSVTDQFLRNGDSATDALSLQESVLSNVSDVLHSIRVLAVNAGNPSLTLSDRTSLATELQSNYDELMGLANSTDGNGLYLFSGYQGNTKPFSETTPGSVVYNGDQGQRLIQLSASRQIPISNSGADIFQLIHNGNGTFVTAQAMAAGAATNKGTGVISPGAVLDATAWNSSTNNKDFSIKFDVDSTVSPPVTTYDIVDNVSGNSLLTGAAAAASGPYLRTYTSGSAISLKTVSPPDTNATPFDYGAEVSVSGDPATGDAFTIKASTNQDIFQTINDLITSLKSGGNNTAITNNNNTALSNLSLVEDKVLTIRASVGAGLKEVDTQNTVGGDLSEQYSSTLSRLQDLDYAKAISDLTQRQVALQAAQQSFVKVQGLSLFNYING